MKFSARPQFLVVACLLLSVLGLHGQSTLPEGILHSITNARITPSAESILLDRLDPATPITLRFTTAQALGVLRESNQWWILPTDLVSTPIHANTDLWILPRTAQSSDHSWHLQLAGTNTTAIKSGEDITVSFPAVVDLTALKSGRAPRRSIILAPQQEATWFQSIAQPPRKLVL